jgi:hypothetical protein
MGADCMACADTSFSGSHFSAISGGGLTSCPGESWGGRYSSGKGVGKMCGYSDCWWESSPWPLCTAPLLILVKRETRWVPTSTAASQLDTLRLGKDRMNSGQCPKGQKDRSQEAQSVQE